MGNWCCPPANPCDSGEERSGLLQQDASKAPVHTAETGVLGAFQDSPESEVDVGKTSDEAKITEEEKVVTDQVKPSPWARETEFAKIQENGPIQEEHQQTQQAPPPGNGAGLEPDSTVIAQDKNAEDTATDNGPFESLQCTLESPQTEDSTTEPQVSTEVNLSAETKEVVVEEVLTAVQGKIPDGVSQESDEVPPENLAIGAEVLTEHITLETACDDDDKDEDDRSKVTIGNAVDRPSEDPSLCNEVSLSLPDSPLPAETCQGSSSMCGHETGTEASPFPSSVSPSSAVMKELASENGSDGKEHSPDDLLVKSHDTPEPSPEADTALLKHNGVEPASTRPSAASESPNSGKHSEVDLRPPPAGPSEAASPENPARRDIEAEETGSRVKGEDKDVAPRAEEDGGGVEEEEETGVILSEREGETLELDDGDDLAAGVSAVAEVVPVSEQEELAEEGSGNSDEDLYRGAEELTPNQDEKAGPVPLFEITLPKVEDRCSLAPAVDILSYSEREWKGNTAKSALIRKGYKEMSQRFVSLRRVRGDNYCALRATLFQLLSTSTHLPGWLKQEDVTMLPKELEAREGLISQWTFPGECQQGDGAGDAAQQLKRYMELLRNRWQAAVDCSSAEERQSLCERVFRGGEEELGLLEALKLLMLGRAVELHASMQAGGDVPVFCWLLFARDSSECPGAFLSNHLSRVGFSGGLEQVEMFLLGYALRCTIQVYRLYMAETEEFVTYYPDDHKEDWPSVCLVTEDDRHYNVPVGDASELPEDLPPS